MLMSNDNQFSDLEEQRRKKADGFQLNIRDDYDEAGDSTSGEPPAADGTMKVIGLSG